MKACWQTGHFFSLLANEERGGLLLVALLGVIVGWPATEKKERKEKKCQRPSEAGYYNYIPI